MVDCSIECGVESLVFTSSADVVPPRTQCREQGRTDGAINDSVDAAEGKKRTYVTRQEDARAHAVARAEASVLKAR